MAAEIAEARQDGHPVHVLRSAGGELEARFAPRLGMVGCSLRHRGDELLDLRGGLTAYAERGSTMGIPLLAPWANRLDGFAYRAAGRTVDLDPARTPLRLDPNGLPIHGLLAASPHWEVTGAGVEDGTARLAATLDFGAHEELLSGFPFPHRLEQAVALDDAALTISTTVYADSGSAVPVSFGYHPYLRLPRVARDAWEITLPVRRHAALDERGIPTGDSETVTPTTAPLGPRTFDDLFDQLDPEPEFVLAGAGRRIGVRFEAGCPYAQVYAPPGEELICFEPMTAPTNALVSGDGLTVVEPGGSYAARFSITVG